MNLRQRTQKQVVYETCVFLCYRVVVNTLYISVLKKETVCLYAPDILYVVGTKCHHKNSKAEFFDVVVNRFCSYEEACKRY